MTSPLRQSPVPPVRVSALGACLIALIVRPGMCAFPRTPRATAVGFQQVRVPDLEGRYLDVAIWYPTTAEPAAVALGAFTQVVATNAVVSGSSRSLILISHGTAGSLSSHLDTALRLGGAGFVVAAPTHTGDNFRDQTYAGNRRDLIDRPRQLKRVADYVLREWVGRHALDSTRMGIFGFSLGGFAALVEAGGVPNLHRMAELCSERPDAPECAFIRQRQGDQLDPIRETPVWVTDRRIQAVVIAAPAAAYLFGGGGLRNVSIPVQLWRAEEDQQAPDAWNSAIVRQELPRPPDEHVVAEQDHFVFLAPCSDALIQTAPSICRDKPGFNRTAFHQSFNAAIVAFLKQSFRSRDP